MWVRQVTVHAQVQLQINSLVEAVMEWVVRKPIYLIDFATYAVPPE